MEARIKNPVLAIPAAMEALQSLGQAVQDCGVPQPTFEMVRLRASQINGCSVCVDMHARALKKAGESDRRIFAVGAWRETPYFTDAERAALALAEAETRIADRSDAVPDDVWNEAARHYDDQQLAALTIDIAHVNLWNRLNATTRQIVGAAW